MIKALALVLVVLKLQPWVDCSYWACLWLRQIAQKVG